MPRDPEIDERQPAYILPKELKTAGKALENAGIHIVYGPNPSPAPELLSDQAKKAWLGLPLVPLPANDAKKLAATRALLEMLEQVEFQPLKDPYSILDETINGITTMWVTPPELKHDDKIMIFIHGGAYVVNSRKTQLAFQASVASTLGMKVASIEYPLAPEHPYPAATNSIVAAYQGLLDRYEAGNMGLFGTSAGGGLVLATLLRLKRDHIPLPAATAALSPAADMTLSGDFFTLVGDKDSILPLQDLIDSFAAYVDNADPSDPLVSPVFGDYTDMPPIFLLAGTRELIGSDAIRTAAQARSNGCDVTLVISDGMWHVPIAADGSGVPELQLAFDEMIKFLRRHLDI
jgi:acetyl esterase/lipase